MAKFSANFPEGKDRLPDSFKHFLCDIISTTVNIVV